MPPATIQPAPGTPDYEYQMSHWDDDARAANYAGIIISTVFATLFLSLRLFAQKRYQGGWYADDYLLISGYFFALAISGASIMDVAAGMGLHQLRVITEDSSPPYGVIRAFQGGWITSVCWAPSVTFIKLSLLFFYRRIFLVQQRWFKIALWLNAFYAAGLGIGSTFEFIFQCLPVSYFWERFSIDYGITPTVTGSCLPQTVHLATPAILSTISDVLILLLPLAVLFKLKLDAKRKFGLMAIFSLGCFVIGCGIARIVFTFQVTNAQDVTWNDLNTVTFTTVECCVGVICASLPACGPIYNLLLKRSRNAAPHTILSSRQRKANAQKLDSALGSTRNLHEPGFEMEDPKAGTVPWGNSIYVSGPRHNAESKQSTKAPPRGAIQVERGVEWSSSRFSDPEP